MNNHTVISYVRIWYHNQNCDITWPKVPDGSRQCGSAGSRDSDAGRRGCFCEHSTHATRGNRGFPSLHSRAYELENRVTWMIVWFQVWTEGGKSSNVAETVRQNEWVLSQSSESKGVCLTGPRPGVAAVWTRMQSRLGCIRPAGLGVTQVRILSNQWVLCQSMTVCAF